MQTKQIMFNIMDRARGRAKVYITAFVGSSQHKSVLKYTKFTPGSKSKVTEAATIRQGNTTANEHIHFERAEGELIG